MQLNIIFRNPAKILCMLFLLGGCKGGTNNEAPEKAIDPSVVENPATSSGVNVKDRVPVLKFETDKHDFGTITEGEKVSFAFNFTNVGKGDLVIRAAQGSCGCTVPEYPKEAVPPGKGGIINVTFNSAGKEGAQMKTVDVISNTIPNVYKLYISGNVIKDTK